MRIIKALAIGAMVLSVFTMPTLAKDREINEDAKAATTQSSVRHNQNRSYKDQWQYWRNHGTKNSIKRRGSSVSSSVKDGINDDGPDVNSSNWRKRNIENANTVRGEDGDYDMAHTVAGKVNRNNSKNIGNRNQVERGNVAGPREYRNPDGTINERYPDEKEYRENSHRHHRDRDYRNGDNDDFRHHRRHSRDYRSKDKDGLRHHRHHRSRDYRDGDNNDYRNHRHHPRDYSDRDQNGSREHRHYRDRDDKSPRPTPSASPRHRSERSRDYRDRDDRSPRPTPSASPRPRNERSRDYRDRDDRSPRPTPSASPRPQRERTEDYRDRDDRSPRPAPSASPRPQRERTVTSPSSPEADSRSDEK